MEIIKTKKLFIAPATLNYFFYVRHLFPVILLVGGLTLKCSSQNWQWAKSTSGSGTDEGWSVSADASGNVFVAGNFNSNSITFGTTTLTKAGGYCDVFIAKYNATGNILWAKSVGGTGTDVGNGISTDISGNVFITGQFDSPTIMFGSIALTNGGVTSTIYIAKYDATGNVLWAKSSTGTVSNPTNGYSVSTDISGNAFITGYFKSPSITFGTTTLTNVDIAGSTYDIFLAKYDASGNVLWAKSAGGTSFEESYSVSSDINGNVFVTGDFYSSTIVFGSTTLTNAVAGGGSYDAFIAKYDANGNVLWATRTGGTGYDEGYSVSSVDAAGNMFVTGWFNSPSIIFGSTTLTNVGSLGSYDAFIAKYDANGNVLWATRAGGTIDDKGYSVSADAGGNVFATGAFDKAFALFPPYPTITFGSTVLTPLAGATDPMYIVKYDGNGNVLCASALSSGGDDAFAISADPFGNVYIGSDFEQNPFVVGSTTLNRTGTENVFVAKYSCSNILSASVSHTNLFCNAQCAGTATANPSGGTSPYTYSWNNSKTTQAITGLCAGNYTVTITDAVSGSIKQVVSITEPTILTAGLTSTSLTCNGTTTGIATATVTGGTIGYGYLWNTTQTSSTLNNLAAGGYTVTVTDNNGCSIVVSGFINEPLAISTTVTASTASCFQSDGFAVVMASGGTGGLTYVWSNLQTTATISNLNSALYSVTVTDSNGCTRTDAIQINNFPGVTAQVISSTSVTCFGLCNGVLTIDGTGGSMPYSFQWNTGKTESIITGLCVGVYTATVTDSGGCTSSTSFNINEPTLLSATLIASNVSCFGGNNGSITANVSGGTSPYSYSWNTAQSTSTINNITIGTYTVTITDANGCSQKLSTTINQSPAITVTLTPTHSICNQNNGSAIAIASGGTGTFIYRWNNGKTTLTISGLSAGIYSITVTDGNGCTTIKNTTINNLNGVTAQIVSSVSVTCNGLCNGSAVSSGTGGNTPYTYLWNNGQTTAIATNLCGINYFVTITDNSGCTSIAGVTIGKPAALTLTVTGVSITCNGNNNGLVTANVLGGTSPYSYNWNNGQNNPAISNLTMGIYTVTVTDANGCSVENSKTITQPSVLTITISATSDCGANNASATVITIGGTPVYSYQWNNGKSTAVNNNLSTGSYTVTVSDANNCTAKKTVNVVSGATIAATVSNDVTILLGTNTTLSVSGGGRYQWSPASGLSCVTCKNPVANPLSTTYYCVIVSNTYCSDTACVTVNVDSHCEPFIPTAFSPNEDGENDIECIYSGTCLSPMLFKIFDRWGEVVFKTKDPTGCWDGRYKGKLMTTGIFYYIFEGTYITGEKISKQGTISLIR